MHNETINTILITVIVVICIIVAIYFIAFSYLSYKQWKKNNKVNAFLISLLNLTPIAYVIYNTVILPFNYDFELKARLNMLSQLPKTGIQAKEHKNIELVAYPGNIHNIVPLLSANMLDKVIINKSVYQADWGEQCIFANLNDGFQFNFLSIAMAKTAFYRCYKEIEKTNEHADVVVSLDDFSSLNKSAICKSMHNPFIVEIRLKMNNQSTLIAYKEKATKHITKYEFPFSFYKWCEQDNRFFYYSVFIAQVLGYSKSNLPDNKNLPEAVNMTHVVKALSVLASAKKYTNRNEGIIFLLGQWASTPETSRLIRTLFADKDDDFAADALIRLKKIDQYSGLYPKLATHKADFLFICEKVHCKNDHRFR